MELLGFTFYIIISSLIILLITFLIIESDKDSKQKQTQVIQEPKEIRHVLLEKENPAELKLRKLLNDSLPKDEYHLINNLLLETNGETHQIDHVLVSKYGIFVIETKDYSGYITGSEYDNRWVRHLRYGKKVYYPNPIKQNYGHVKCVSELLDINTKNIHNMVCIFGDVRVRINHNGELTLPKTILGRIYSYREEVIDNPHELAAKLINSNITDIEKRNEHILKLRDTKEEYEINRCPKCGATLLLKEGKNGKFYGCSNYPQCRYTRNKNYY